jgi:hypothetical protein
MMRFWRKVLRGGPDDCWPFLGKARAGNQLQYGKTRWPERAGKPMNAHKVAFLLSKGPVPDGYVIRHACDNPLCCNPDHLDLGLQLDNVRDQILRGRNTNQLKAVERGEPMPQLCGGCRRALAVDRGMCRPCNEAIDNLAVAI